MFILVYGADTFRSAEKLHELTRQFKNKYDESGMNAFVEDGAGLALAKLRQAVFSTPFLSSRRLVVIKGLQNGDYDIKDALSILRSAPPDTIIIDYEEKSAKGLKKIIDAKPDFLYEFEFQQGAALLQWARDRIKKAGITLDQKGLAKLIEIVGSKSAKLASEIEKLKNLDKNTIGEEDVCGVVSGSATPNTFQLIDALALKRNAEALRLLQKELEAGSDPEKILYLLARQFRLLAESKAQGVPKGIKSNPSSYIQEKIRKQSAGWSLEEIKKAYQKLLLADKNIKTAVCEAGSSLALFAANINRL